MSVYSMTGFGRGEATGDKFSVVVEIKTVNNRFKDFRFKMSSIFNHLEFDLRTKMEQEFKRGSFEISINYQTKQDIKTEMALDHKKIAAFVKQIKEIVGDQVTLTVSPTEFLRSDFSLEDEEEKKSMLIPLMKEAFNKAIPELKQSREKEGSALTLKLKEHLSVYEKLLVRSEVLKETYPELVRARLEGKLREKLQDLKVDENRLLQEIIYYLEKLEVDEEISRAKIHLKKVDDIFKNGGEVGRQLDFLLQELGRETNTLGSKSNHQEISQNVVEMKVQLEKIREQALNLE